MSNTQARSRILLTGATGFIGQRLQRALELNGHEVVTVSRRASNDSKKVLNIDLSCQKIAGEQLSEIETVYHLAGYAHDLSDPSKVADRYRALNTDGTLNLARASIAAGVKRFIFVSSVKAGGITSTGLDMDETSIALPDGIYGETKRRAEEALLSLTKSETMDATVVRPALVYGPAVKGNLALMLKGIAAGWFPPIPETRNQRSMIHVDDLVEALLFVASHHGTAGEIFIATDGQRYSTKRIYDELREALGKSPTGLAIPKVGFDILGKIRPSLGFKLQKLFGNEGYSSAKLQALGFNASRTLRDINETRY